MMSRKKKDLALGLKSEIEVKPILEKHLNVKLENTGHYDTFDFVGKDIYIELKARTNKRRSYPTTMIGKNKIDEGLQLLKKKKRVILAFKFTNGLFIYELKEDCLTNGDMSISNGGRWDRGFNEIKKYAYIDVEKLTRIYRVKH
jgi:hypothetical protein